MTTTTSGPRVVLVDDTADLRQSHIVVENVDRREGLHAGLDHGFDAFRIRDIALYRNRLAALATDELSGLLGGIKVDVGAAYACSLAGEQHRRGLAVAPARTDRSGTRHQRHLAIKPADHVSSPS